MSLSLVGRFGRIIEVGLVRITFKKTPRCTSGLKLNAHVQVTRAHNLSSIGTSIPMNLEYKRGRPVGIGVYGRPYVVGKCNVYVPRIFVEMWRAGSLYSAKI